MIARPGDVLLVSTPANLTAEQVAAIRQAIIDNLPGIADVLVMSSINQVGVYRANT
jgi:hypothetical protein